ncbi:restriction endonuclease subunit S [Cronobacter turicensis]|uniref:restriction endonuclease subunit S n=1 Tax=Cronobacter turicensis TaxID=413502 RepID=UPI0024C332E0|nr:restriction endonuclease subunit S [Cronobacter turicensis]
MTLNEKTKSMKQEAVLLDYKKTEVGIIPKDWIVLDIAKTMKLINGYGFKPSQWEKEGLPIIRIQNLNDANAPYNYFPGVIDTKFHVKNGDLLFAWSGSKGVSFGARVWQGKKAILNQHIFKIIPNENFITANYSYYVLRKVQEQIEKMAHGFKSSFVHVKKGDLENTPLPIPPKKEQTAIANVLSDTDALITELEKLIAKKQAIKTATMQQLLTGRTRLPQYSKHPDGTIKSYKHTELGLIPVDWIISTIDECANKVGSGKTPSGGSSVYTEAGHPFVRSQNIGWGKLELSDIAYISDSIHKTFPGTELVENDVLLNITGASIGRCALSDFRIAGGNVNQHVCIIRLNSDKLIPKLLVELMNADIGQNQIDSFQAGGNREGLNFSQVRQLRFAIPISLEEQNTIATILSDMDAELTALERKLAKFLDLKQGMMQQLLTGRIRLPLEQQS